MDQQLKFSLWQVILTVQQDVPLPALLVGHGPGRVADS